MLLMTHLAFKGITKFPEAKEKKSMNGNVSKKNKSTCQSSEILTGKNTVVILVCRHIRFMTIRYSDHS